METLVISEALNDLQKVIENAEELLSQHPEHKGLQFSLMQYQKRKEVLTKELQNEKLPQVGVEFQECVWHGGEGVGLD